MATKCGAPRRRRPRPLHAVEEVLLEDVRLERAARLAGDDDERAREIDAALDVRHLRRARSSPGRAVRARRAAVRTCEPDLGAEAGAAHAEQQRVREAVRRDTGRRVRARARSFAACASIGVEPAEPLRFVRCSVQSDASLFHSRATRRSALSHCPTAAAIASGACQAARRCECGRHAQVSCAFAPGVVSLDRHATASARPGPAGTISWHGAQGLPARSATSEHA